MILYLSDDVEKRIRDHKAIIQAKIPHLLVRFFKVNFPLVHYNVQSLLHKIYLGLNCPALTLFLLLKRD